MLGITISNYNNYPVTEQYLESMDKQINKDFHVFLVDVSTEKKSYPSYSWLTIIQTENNGYSWNVNKGTAAAIQAGYANLVEMNNDVEVEASFVDDVLASLAQHKDSIIGAKIYYFKGFEFHKESYSPADLGHVIWYAGGHQDWNHVITIHRGVNEVDTGQYDMCEKTEFITGCFMAFTKKTHELVGPWDESYFLYYEDADWCERAKRKGVSLMYDPSIKIWHKNGQSTEGSGSIVQQNYQEKNRIKFGLRYAPLRTKMHLIKNYLRGKLIPQVY